jgi:hypothetical protein
VKSTVASSQSQVIVLSQSLNPPDPHDPNPEPGVLTMVPSPSSTSEALMMKWMITREPPTHQTYISLASPASSSPAHPGHRQSHFLDPPLHQLFF